ncbi:MAG: Glutamate 5-kinase [Alphaproteobacteria bacterium MarineAlpha4_Bin2]|nr:MAG: Glutamate 5-kinase [Alphaproteobacteria bacterium MarineAlpha4_Bin2]
MIKDLSRARRLVVKIGSALLVHEETGAIRRDWLNALADDIHHLRAVNTDILVVSSGAIAVGRRHLGLMQNLIRLEEKQAAAASGQIQLAHAYQEALARHQISVAQILVTLGDTEERRRHLNARSTIMQLLALGAVPVVNENDTVATTEIRFGDNDRLAARVAAMISADTLVLLSDIDGLYARDPRIDASADHISRVDEITPEIEAMGGRAPTGYSSGGMETKIQAAKIATAAGCRMVIANGVKSHPLKRLTEGARCTWFMPSASPLTARKRWIVGSLNPIGEILIDIGAERALKQGKSLLPAGVVGVRGSFERGDAVIVRSSEGHELARGLSAYSDVDAARIAGRRSVEIAKILGYRGRDELIHRDDLVLTS